MCGDQARSQDQLKIKLGPVLALAGRQPACQLDPSLQVCDGLEIGRAQGRVLAGLEPVSDRRFSQSGFGQMVRQRFGLSLQDFREPLLERVRNGGVQMHAAASHEAGICGVPYQRVLEGVNRVWALAPAENQFRPRQLAKRLFQFLPRQSRDGVQQFVMELATRDGADLCTSRTGANRSRPAISEACNVVGIAKGGSGRSRTYWPSCSCNSPLSSTVLVSSSMNSGTPSVRARISSMTSFGSLLPLVTRSTNAAPSRRPRRVSGTVVMCE